MSVRRPNKARDDKGRLLTRRERDALSTEARLRDALKRNGGKPLSVVQLERIGLRPKGIRSSTGRRPV